MKITVVQFPGSNVLHVGEMIELEFVEYRVVAIEQLGPPEFVIAGTIDLFAIPHKVIATLEKLA